ncbi:lactonase family protein, partial [Paenarthrobacter ureafaciens]|uniref:lactonase family protein n=1 Tax=Paenarthrobacter ureafaciens TaxID=37931 RepID=UPI003978B6D2
MAADPQGRFIITTCWGDGQVILFELDDDGAITSRFSAEAAVDPHHNGPTDEPRPSRAHSSLMLPDGRILTADLGNDLVRVWTYRPGSGLQADHQVILPQGSGPRHMVRHSSGTVFVDTEYSLEVAAIRSERQGVFELTAMVPVSVNKPFDGDAAAEIALSPDGRFAYVGVRGSNRM